MPGGSAGVWHRGCDSSIGSGAGRRPVSRGAGRAVVACRDRLLWGLGDSRDVLGGVRAGGGRCCCWVSLMQHGQELPGGGGVEDSDPAAAGAPVAMDGFGRAVARCAEQHRLELQRTADIDDVAQTGEQVVGRGVHEQQDRRHRRVTRIHGA
jgi:hypothetical protein